MSSESDHEEAVLRRRFDEWTFRGVTLLFPVVIAIGGWAFTLQTRLQEIATQQAERAPRLVLIEEKLAAINEAAKDPSSKLETKVTMEALRLNISRMDDRVTRLEERVNNLHNYMLALPVRPAPAPYVTPPSSRRGDLGLEEYLKRHL